MTGEGNSGHIKSVGTVLSLLEEMCREEPIGVTELSETVDQSKGTVHHYLKTLEDRGYVERVGSEYTLGLRFLNLGGRARKRERIFQLSRDDVDRLAAETGEKARLIIERDWESITLYQATGDNVDSTRTHVGHIESLHSTAGGKALLAGKPDDEVEEYIESGELPARTDNTITDVDELWAEIERIRSSGVAVDDEEHYEDIRCVAAPVVVSEDRVLATLSISAPSHRMDEERFRSVIPGKLETAAGVVEVNTLYSEWVDS